MSSLPKYINLARYVKNWPLYFQRLHERNLTARYTTRREGLLFDVPPAFYDVFREIFMEDFYEVRSLVSRLRSDAVVVDIGGNVGYFSFLLASLLPGSRILCFEPMAENVAVFNNNLALNKGLAGRIHVFEKAVTGNFNGAQTIFFDDVGDNSVVASLLDNFSELNVASRSVEALSLAEIIARNELQHIDLIKLDCEGSEYAILYESPDELFNKIGALAIETHDMDNDQRNTRALTEFLKARGFQVQAHLRDNNCFNLKAEKLLNPA